MPKLPCRVSYSKREIPTSASRAVVKRESSQLLSRDHDVEVRVDTQLCQGHSVCVSEAPSVFRVGESGEAELLPSAARVANYPLEGKSGETRDVLFTRLERAYEHCPNRAITLTQID